MVNILARILDSERNFNGSADPMITVDRGFIQFLGPDSAINFSGSADLHTPIHPPLLRKVKKGKERNFPFLFIRLLFATDVSTTSTEGMLLLG